MAKVQTTEYNYYEFNRGDVNLNLKCETGNTKNMRDLIAVLEEATRTIQADLAFWEDENK